LELKFLIDLSLSYYNDSLNQWEPLIETLPEEGDRMWSLQLELISMNNNTSNTSNNNNNNKAECLTNDDGVDNADGDDDWVNVGCLQASTNTILILSRDNLEITISKIALDMLNNLGRSFEAAYKLKNIKSKYNDSTDHIVAPYRIVNKTGCQLVIRYNAQALSLVHFNNDHSIIQTNSTQTSLGSSDKAVISSSTGQDSTAAATTTTNQHQSIILDSQREMGFSELTKTERTRSIVSTYKDSRHHIWISLSNASDQSVPRSSISNSEVVFQLYRGDSELLCLAKDSNNNEEKTSNKSDRRITIYPIVADVEACLGVKSITFRSTVQILNNTSERICIYSLLIKSSESTNQQQPGLLTTIDAGHLYSLPVEIVNSRRQTGIFIGPELEKPVISTTPVYWPEFACGVEKYTPSNADSHLPFLAPYAQAVSSTNIDSKTCSSSQFQWPNQLVECRPNNTCSSTSNNNNDSVYFYNVVVVNHDYQSNPFDDQFNKTTTTTTTSSTTATTTTCNIDHQRKTSLTAVADELRTTQSKMLHGDKLHVSYCDFQMIIQTAVVFYNQLPFPISFMLSNITNEISAGSHYALKSIPPNKAFIEISFEYNGNVYRGKLELHLQMDEYSVIEFDSRKEYESCNL
ncbi:unnamed protein product, partial [Schistosoma turkestanicum]